MKHFKTYAGLAVHETGPRGVTVRIPPTNPHMVHLLLHNGCGRGNMLATMSNQQAIEIALELIRMAQR